MKVKSYYFFLFLILFSCKQSIEPTIEEEMKKAMNDFLYQSVNNDSSKVKYRVETVNYFEEVKYYDCEFKVRVITAQKDTTGLMTATVSKDFKTVKRKS